jgi:hypothetical protein
MGRGGNNIFYQLIAWSNWTRQHLILMFLKVTSSSFMILKLHEVLLYNFPFCFLIIFSKERSSNMHFDLKYIYHISAH